MDSDDELSAQELNLKISAIDRLLAAPPPLRESPSLNTLWTGLMVEELCRLGVQTFCIAPGSRSTPLTAAIAQHPCAKIVPCLDERSLAFWAVGYGRATRWGAAILMQHICSHMPFDLHNDLLHLLSCP